MKRPNPAFETVAEAYLATLARRGIDHLFANADTDFAPLIEALARARVPLLFTSGRTPFTETGTRVAATSRSTGGRRCGIRERWSVST